MVYTGDLKSPAERIEGSSPSSRTKIVVPGDENGKHAGHRDQC